MNKKKLLLDILEVIGSAAIITFIIIKFVFFPCSVDGSSMHPTLVDGDFGYSLVFSKNIGINRFDIVVIEVNDADKLIVKRVIGMPGDEIEYKDNKLYINGEYYKEEYLKDVTTNDLKISVGEDEYFCLGDNRNVSKDSRYYGNFNKSQIKSSHVFVVYPFKDFGYRK